jgi:hypothetical protein
MSAAHREDLYGRIARFAGRMVVTWPSNHPAVLRASAESSGIPISSPVWILTRVDPRSELVLVTKRLVDLPSQI